MCGWSILSIETYQGELQNKKKQKTKKTRIEWSPSLIANALQGNQIQMKVNKILKPKCLV